MNIETTVETAITYEDSPDGGHLNIIDPYDGCTIGCPYCFQRTDTTWSHPIKIKVNLPDLIRKGLTGLKPNESVYIGSRCDPYMPMEKRYRLTRSCLKLLSEMHIPTFVCTKGSSDLIERDLDIMESFQTDFTMVLGLSNVSQIECTGDSSKTENVKLVKKLHKHGIKTWVFITPVLPGITDVHAILNELPTEIQIWLFDIQRPIPDVVKTHLLRYIKNKFPRLLDEYLQICNGKCNQYYEDMKKEYASDSRFHFPYG
jgi:DNA repair photolyase